MDEPVELSAMPSPPENDLTSATLFPATTKDYVPDPETKQKYRRSATVPDYRATIFPNEPKFAYMPAVNKSQQNRNGRPRRSTAETTISNNGSVAMSPKVSATTSANTSRRGSLQAMGPTKPAHAHGHSTMNSSVSSIRDFETSARPFRSENQDTVNSRPATATAIRSGTVSPMTHRSISPDGYRNGTISPISRSGSPVRMRQATSFSGIDSERTVPTGRPRKSSSTTQMQRRMAAQRELARMQLDTNVSSMGQPSTSNSTANGDSEEMLEVVSLSPAVRGPSRLSLRRTSKTQLTSMSEQDESRTTLPGVGEEHDDGGDGSVPKNGYFGQTIDQEDLLAVNLENAFERL